MAKVTAPLQSFEAHGSVAKSLTFRKDNGRNVVSAYTIPGGFAGVEVSAAQAAQRAAYSAAIAAWHALTLPQQETYNTRARRFRLTGYNLFLRENIGGDTPPPPVPTWDGNASHPFKDWERRIKVTIPATSLSAPLENFPVYVDLSLLPVLFFVSVQNGGGDIRVTKADGISEVAREVVKCDTTEETGELHFLASALSATENTDFYIYYGNSGASDYATNATYGAQHVWTEDFVLVSHDGGGTDSTANDNDGTAHGGVGIGNATGKVGVATAFDGSNDYINLGDKDVFSFGNGIEDTPFTISAWCKPVDLSNFILLSKYQNTTAGNGEWSFGFGGNDTLNFALIDGPVSNREVRASNDPYTSYEGQWISVGVTYNGIGGLSASGGIELYFAGQKISNTNTSIDAGTYVAMENTPTAVIAGANLLNFGTPNYANGQIDEIRISSIARSSAWISAEYNNQESPSTFSLFGSIELKD